MISKFVKFMAVLGSLLCTMCIAPTTAIPLVSNTATPFANNNGTTVPPGQYSGPYFKLSHDYPATAPVPEMPWRIAIQNGLITTTNAKAYGDALKQAVGKDMKVLLQDYENWDAAERGWYNEPWLGSLREPIHGMYVGTSEFDPTLFKKSGLTKPITTYVLTYYDKTAAQTLYHIWNKTAMKPTITSSSTQFAEGSLIIKASFITADGTVWPVMSGAQTWPLYISTNATTGSTETVLTNTSFMQFDIIVKDSQSAPQTGWVFSTLVYDNRIKPSANGVWDQMVVLGVQWGNDPQADDPKNPTPILLENWNNPAAPAYGGETFGWGERLSGPNDGAMNSIAYVVDGKTSYVKTGKNSSCMSCHSSAQWNTDNPALGMTSFLLPLLTALPAPPSGCPDQDQCGYLDSPVPGSPLWMKWFQDRKGNQPMDVGSVATDFDMVLPFKSLPQWYAATQNEPHRLLDFDLSGRKSLDSSTQ